MTEMKEKNFISAVVYLHGEAENAVSFLSELDHCLDHHFAQYEIVAVNDGCSPQAMQRVRQYAKDNLKKPLTLLHMSLRQGVEMCMNAGLDMAIGDFVYEFDSTQMPYKADLIWQAYQKALEGNDIVNVCPTAAPGSSKLFYKIFNMFHKSPNKLRTEAFRLVSRRAINRVHAVSENLPYRKAAYAACGLKAAELLFEGKMNGRQQQRFGLAVDSLALYTDAGYKLSLGVAGFMLLLTLAELIYTLYIFFGRGHAIEGWTTTMFVLTVGFAGVFAILAMVLKYLSLLVDLVFKKQKYLVEGIEKIQK